MYWLAWGTKNLCTWKYRMYFLELFSPTLARNRNEVINTSITSISSIFTFTFTFMHLADAFIQSDLQCIQVIHLSIPWELNPQPFALLTQCSTTESQEHYISCISINTRYNNYKCNNLFIFQLRKLCNFILYLTCIMKMYAMMWRQHKSPLPCKISGHCSLALRLVEQFLEGGAQSE